MEMGGWKFACFQVCTAFPRRTLAHIYMSQSNQHTKFDTPKSVIGRGITFMIFHIIADFVWSCCMFGHSHAGLPIC